MDSKTVVKTTVFPSCGEQIWDKLQQLQTLQFIAFPYATFKPLNAEQSLIWREGEAFNFRFKPFGIVPFGLHKISVVKFDKATFEIYTKKANTYVPVWNHRIFLKQIDDSSTEYTDEVEINAGWKTPFVYMWAKAFYAHRQRKWLKLLEDK